jgi:hypothetical protein
LVTNGDNLAAFRREKFGFGGLGSEYVARPSCQFINSMKCRRAGDAKRVIQVDPFRIALGDSL